MSASVDRAMRESIGLVILLLLIFLVSYCYLCRSPARHARSPTDPPDTTKPQNAPSNKTPPHMPTAPPPGPFTGQAAPPQIPTPETTPANSDDGSDPDTPFHDALENQPKPTNDVVNVRLNITDKDGKLISALVRNVLPSSRSEITCATGHAGQVPVSPSPAWVPPFTDHQEVAQEQAAPPKVTPPPGGQEEALPPPSQDNNDAIVMLARFDDDLFNPPRMDQVDSQQRVLDDIFRSSKDRDPGHVTKFGTYINPKGDGEGDAVKLENAVATSIQLDEAAIKLSGGVNRTPFKKVLERIQAEKEQVRADKKRAIERKDTKEAEKKIQEETELFLCEMKLKKRQHEEEAADTAGPGGEREKELEALRARPPLKPLEGAAAAASSADDAEKAKKEDRKKKKEKLKERLLHLRKLEEAKQSKADEGVHKAPGNEERIQAREEETRKELEAIEGEDKAEAELARKKRAEKAEAREKIAKIEKLEKEKLARARSEEKEAKTDTAKEDGAESSGGAESADRKHDGLAEGEEKVVHDLTAEIKKQKEKVDDVEKKEKEKVDDAKKKDDEEMAGWRKQRLRDEAAGIFKGREAPATAPTAKPKANKEQEVSDDEDTDAKGDTPRSKKAKPPKRRAVQKTPLAVADVADVADDDTADLNPTRATPSTRATPKARRQRQALAAPSESAPSVAQPAGAYDPLPLSQPPVPVQARNGNTDRPLAFYPTPNDRGASNHIPLEPEAGGDLRGSATSSGGSSGKAGSKLGRRGAKGKRKVESEDKEDEDSGSEKEKGSQEAKQTRPPKVTKEVLKRQKDEQEADRKRKEEEALTPEEREKRRLAEEARKKKEAEDERKANTLANPVMEFPDDVLPQNGARVPGRGNLGDPSKGIKIYSTGSGSDKVPFGTKDEPATTAEVHAEDPATGSDPFGIGRASVRPRGQTLEELYGRDSQSTEDHSESFWLPGNAPPGTRHVYDEYGKKIVAVMTIQPMPDDPSSHYCVSYETGELYIGDQNGMPKRSVDGSITTSALALEPPLERATGETPVQPASKILAIEPSHESDSWADLFGRQDSTRQNQRRQPDFVERRSEKQPLHQSPLPSSSGMTNSPTGFARTIYSISDRNTSVRSSVSSKIARLSDIEPSSETSPVKSNTGHPLIESRDKGLSPSMPDNPRDYGSPLDRGNSRRGPDTDYKRRSNISDGGMSPKNRHSRPSHKSNGRGEDESDTDNERRGRSGSSMYRNDSDDGIGSRNHGWSPREGNEREWHDPDADLERPDSGYGSSRENGEAQAAQTKNKSGDPDHQGADDPAASQDLATPSFTSPDPPDPQTQEVPTSVNPAPSSQDDTQGTNSDSDGQSFQSASESRQTPPGNVEPDQQDSSEKRASDPLSPQGVDLEAQSLKNGKKATPDSPLPSQPDQKDPKGFKKPRQQSIDGAGQAPIEFAHKPKGGELFNRPLPPRRPKYDTRNKVRDPAAPINPSLAKQTGNLVSEDRSAVLSGKQTQRFDSYPRHPAPLTFKAHLGWGGAWGTLLLGEVIAWIEGMRILGSILVFDASELSKRSDASTSSTTSFDTTEPQHVSTFQHTISQMLSNYDVSPTGIFGLLNLWCFLSLIVAVVLWDRTAKHLEPVWWHMKPRPGSFWQHPWRLTKGGRNAFVYISRELFTTILMGAEPQSPMRLYRRIKGRGLLYTIARVLIFVLMVFVFVIALRQSLQLLSDVVKMDAARGLLIPGPDTAVTAEFDAGVAERWTPNQAFMLVNVVLGVGLLTLTVGWYALMNPSDDGDETSASTGQGEKRADQGFSARNRPTQSDFPGGRGREEGRGKRERQRGT